MSTAQVPSCESCGAPAEGKRCAYCGSLFTTAAERPEEDLYARDYMTMRQARMTYDYLPTPNY